MSGTKPAPMVPVDVDLRDFAGMWVDTERLLKSDTWLLGTGDEKAAAMTLWLESWHQVPAGSLPNNDRVLARLSQAERWPKSKAHALRGWVECSDGRLYHPVVAEKAIEAWIEKLSSAISGAMGNAKRWNATIDTKALREQFCIAVEALGKIAPGSRVLKKRAVVLILSASRGDSPPDSPPESPPDSPPESPPESGGDRKGPDLTGTEQTFLFKTLLPSVEGCGSAPSAAPPPPPPAAKPPKPEQPPPPLPPPAFDGRNAEALNGKAVVPIATGFALPADWGIDAEALGFKPHEVGLQGELFRQYWASGKGAGTRRSVKGWRQSWSNWLGKAAKDQR